METIVVKVESKSKAKQLIETIKLLNGVTNASMATSEELENISMLKACKEARKTPKASRADVIDALK